MAQKRRFSRLPFRSASTLEDVDGGLRHATQLLDISLKGALVAEPPAYTAEPGTPVRLEVQLQDSPVRIVMEGAVAHRGDGRVGLRCTSIDMDSMIHLRRLMELNLGDPGLLERELFALG